MAESPNGFLGRADRRLVRLEIAIEHNYGAVDTEHPRICLCPTVADPLGCRQIKLVKRERWLIIGVGHWLTLSRLGTPRSRRRGYGRARLRARLRPRTC